MSYYSGLVCSGIITMLPSIEQRLALELAAKPAQVAAAIALLDEGATVPFIARYRKEATGGWTTPSCVCSKSACATCASWKIAAPVSWHRSPSKTR
jgi:hypothetical protein